MTITINSRQGLIPLRPSHILTILNKTTQQHQSFCLVHTDNNGNQQVLPINQARLKEFQDLAQAIINRSNELIPNEDLPSITAYTKESAYNPQQASYTKVDPQSHFKSSLEGLSSISTLEQAWEKLSQIINHSGPSSPVRKKPPLALDRQTTHHFSHKSSFTPKQALLRSPERRTLSTQITTAHSFNLKKHKTTQLGPPHSVKSHSTVTSLKSTSKDTPSQWAPDYHHVKTPCTGLNDLLSKKTSPCEMVFSTTVSEPSQKNTSFSQKRLAPLPKEPPSTDFLVELKHEFNKERDSYEKTIQQLQGKVELLQKNVSFNEAPPKKHCLASTQTLAPYSASSLRPKEPSSKEKKELINARIQLRDLKNQLNDINSPLKQQNRDLNTTLTLQNQELTQLRHSHSQLSQHNRSLSETIEQLQKKTLLLETNNQAIKKELANTLNKKRENYEQALKQLQAKIALLQKNARSTCCSSSTQTLTTYSAPPQPKELSSKEASELINKLRSLESRLNEIPSPLKQQKPDLKNPVNFQKEELLQLLYYHSQLSQQNHSLSEKIEQLQKETLLLEINNQAIKKDLENKFNKERDTYEKTIKQLQNNIELLQKKTRGTFLSSSTQTSAIYPTPPQPKELSSKEKKELIAARMRLKDLENQLNNLNSPLKQQNQELNRNFNLQKKEFAQLRDSYSRLSKEHTSLSEKIKQFQQQTRLLESDNQSLSSQVVNTQKELQLSTQAIKKELEDKFDKERNSHKNAITQLQAKIELLKKTARLTKARLNGSCSRAIMLTEKEWITSVKTTDEENKNYIERLEEENTDLANNLHQLKLTLTEQHQTIRELKRNLSSLRKTHSTAPRPSSKSRSLSTQTPLKAPSSLLPQYKPLTSPEKTELVNTRIKVRQLQYQLNDSSLEKQELRDTLDQQSQEFFKLYQLNFQLSEENKSLRENIENVQEKAFSLETNTQFLNQKVLTLREQLLVTQKKLQLSQEKTQEEKDSSLANLVELNRLYKKEKDDRQKEFDRECSKYQLKIQQLQHRIETLEENALNTDNHYQVDFAT